MCLLALDSVPAPFIVVSLRGARAPFCLLWGMLFLFAHALTTRAKSPCHGDGLAGFRRARAARSDSYLFMLASLTLLQRLAVRRFKRFHFAFS